MCTVTYLPKSNGGFLLTSNRDEAPHRSPENLDTLQMGKTRLLFPRDTTAGGTWIVAATNGTVVCILNGAYVRHRHEPPYRRSRGLMALDYFSFDAPETFIKQYTFEGMEPFTMLLLERGRVTDLRWDGAKLGVYAKDAGKAHLWSSPTLYDPEAQQKRKNWFGEWLSQQDIYERQAILYWHRTAGEGDPENDVVMNRNNIVRTVSITSIEATKQRLDLAYHDLLRQQTKTAQLPIVHEALAFDFHKD
ncbi:MAG: NRDE family protein [Phaeodactylibacter sp.]|uniref:NRDE family protein n=1 Tax=Phaeodactylibacter sp. TaxID=1940289 RepID=UPI0032EC38B5